MSDRDYAILLDAARWMERHVGVDAPEYSQLDRLSSVVDNIGKRREPNVPTPECEPACFAPKVIIYLLDVAGSGDHVQLPAKVATGFHG